MIQVQAWSQVTSPTSLTISLNQAICQSCLMSISSWVGYMDNLFCSASWAVKTSHVKKCINGPITVTNTLKSVSVWQIPVQNNISPFIIAKCAWKVLKIAECRASSKYGEGQALVPSEFIHHKNYWSNPINSTNSASQLQLHHLKATTYNEQKSNSFHLKLWGDEREKNKKQVLKRVVSACFLPPGWLSWTTNHKQQTTNNYNHKPANPPTGQKKTNLPQREDHTNDTFLELTSGTKGCKTFISGYAGLSYC